MQLAEQPAGISNEKSHLLMSSLDFRGMRLCDGGGTLSANDWQNKSRSVWLKHIEEGFKKALQDQLNTPFSNLTLACCEEEEEEPSSAARRLPPPPSCEKINPPLLSRRRSFRFCLQTTLMFLRHERSHSRWSPNWCCTGNIFNSAALPAIKMSQEEKKTWADQRDRGREEIKFSVKGDIFNTWPRSGEWAGWRCGALQRPLHRRCSFEKITWSLVGICGLLSAVISTLSRSDSELITRILISLLSNSPPPPRLLNLSPPVLLYSFLFPMQPQLQSKNYKLTAHLRRTSGCFIILSNVRRNSWAVQKFIKLKSGCEKRVKLTHFKS